MRVLIIKPTHNCNLKCVYCYDQINKADSSRLTVEDTEKFLTQLREFEDEIQIVWHGGEPLLMPIETYYKPVYEEVLPKLKFKKVTSAMQTNLTLLTPEIFAFCEKHQIMLGTSFDGINNNLTRHCTEEFWNRWNIIQISNEADKVGALMTVDWNNCDTLVESWKSAIVNGLELGFNGYFGNDLTFENQKKIVEGFKKLGDFLIHEEKWPINKLPRPFSPFVEYIMNGNLTMCESVDCQFRWISLAPNGDIYPCGRNWLDKENTFNFGNIHQQPLLDILNSEKRLKFENDLLEFSESCKDCKYFGYCNSGCPNTRFLNTGSITKKDALTCYFVKEIYEYLYQIITSGNFTL